ncbi:MAG: hypothetical protein KME46_29790 [Brasilonema angustatum HA4187-MV1]|jgi:hypothetical protein|nr:hypothetical protein [Brasilonema angustatum HA4187-MV1]
MDDLLQRSRRLISWMAVGTFCFLLLGYIAKTITALVTGVGIALLAINAFGIYLFLCYPELREEVILGIATQIVAALLLFL